MSDKLPQPEKISQAFLRLVDVVRRLRNPRGGCPWDLEQTHESLKPFLIEETYEAISAIDAGNLEELKFELGDVLLQVVLHAQLASESGAFSIDEVIDHVTEKLIYRHPHVFGDVEVNSAGQVLKNWEQLKKKDLAKGKSILDGVPESMPALLRAQRIGEKAARVGFDWASATDTKAKVREEVEEFLTSSESGDLSKEHIEEEFGDLLFALAQLGRHFHFDTESLLQSSTNKFSGRFKKLEQRHPDLTSLSATELDELWEEIKRDERS